jgi:hypothetical protein
MTVVITRPGLPKNTHVSGDVCVMKKSFSVLSVICQPVLTDWALDECCLLLGHPPYVFHSSGREFIARGKWRRQSTLLRHWWSWGCLLVFPPPPSPGPDIGLVSFFLSPFYGFQELPHYGSKYVIFLSCSLKRCQDHETELTGLCSYFVRFPLSGARCERLWLR